MIIKYRNSLTTMRLTGVEFQDIFCRGGRTGRKVHISSTGSSVLNCGHWLKVNAQYYKVPVQQADKMERCEKCFGAQWLEPAEVQQSEKYTEMNTLEVWNMPAQILARIK